MKLKRRELFLSAAVLAVPLQAQAPDSLEQARAAMQANRLALDKIKLPIAVEPAFVFKV